MGSENDNLKIVLDAGAAGAPTVATPDGGLMMVVPERYKAQKVEPLEPPLKRIRQQVALHDLESFIAYVQRFKVNATQIFAEPGFLAGDSEAAVHAVFDYHAAPGTPDYCAHVASYTPRYSEQWERWHKACERPLRQAEFAEFIEEVRGDIVEPSAATLLDIVRKFKASKKVEFDSVVYQPNGDVTLAYDERTEQKGSSGTLPESMKLGIPVYFRGTVYAVPVLVRYQVASGAVVFALKMDRANIIEDTAFAEITAAVKEATAVDVYLGRR